MGLQNVGCGERVGLCGIKARCEFNSGGTADAADAADVAAADSVVNVAAAVDGDNDAADYNCNDGDYSDSDVDDNVVYVSYSLFYNLPSRNHHHRSFLWEGKAKVRGSLGRKQVCCCGVCV